MAMGKPMLPINDMKSKFSIVSPPGNIYGLKREIYGRDSFTGTIFYIEEAVEIRSNRIKTIYY